MSIITVVIDLVILWLAMAVAMVARENLMRPGWRGYILALFGLAVFAIAAIVIALIGSDWSYLLAFGYAAVVFVGFNIYERYVHAH